jgi:hypothetical protein
MEKLTVARMRYLRGVSALLVLQLVIVLVVVAVMRQVAPDAVCLATCGKWTDLLLFLAVIVALIWASHNRRLPIQLRYVAFFSIPAVMAYVLALQYNLIAMYSKNEERTITNFIRAVVLVVALFCANLLLLPFTIRYAGVASVLSVSLFICLIGLILWGLFIEKEYLLWVAVGLFVFLGLLTTDLTLLVVRCRKTGTEQCDPLNGASVLFADLINLLQQIFILLSASDYR